MENINYDWIISATPCKPKEGTLENVVSEVHWRLKVSDTEYAAETYGAVNVPQPTGTEFTPYEQLTKDQVVSWVVDILSVVPEPINGVEQQSQLDKIKENLNKDLELQANPVIVNSPLPFEN